MYTIHPSNAIHHRCVMMSSNSGSVFPSTFRRLIARKVGPSFRSVAEIEEVPLEQPSRDQVLSHERLKNREIQTLDVKQNGAQGLIAPVGLQVLLKIAYAGINGGCETFRCRGSSYTP